MTDWGTEPPLDELLADPTTRLVMSGDHVKEPALRNLLARIRQILRQRGDGTAQAPGARAKR